VNVAAAAADALGDFTDRERAVATFDRNIIVTAGAGTGKTTLLVDRLTHLLARNPDPLKITEIVALTFTNKAASEMKQRLRERLQGYVQAAARRDGDAADAGAAGLQNFLSRYQLSAEELSERLQEALRNIERAEIGTIHSFAASLLRLYPLEAGVDPQFREDEGAQFEALFEREWSLWLDQELALGAARASDWRAVLRKLDLPRIKELARALAAESVELPGANARPAGASSVLTAWIAQLAARAAALVERHPEDRQNERLARAARAVIDAFARHGQLAEESCAAERILLAEAAVNPGLKGWGEADTAEARALARIARGLAQVDASLTELLRRLLTPFAERFRRFFVQQGFCSFDGLLVGARNLVRDHPAVREELKRKYRSILVDEFQDTDPLQYEILLYLAEVPGAAANDWRAVKLTPGKIFVVGDPKQSIYAFRRADIEAYLEVVDKVIRAQHGLDCRLTTNFRSHGRILWLVNAVFEKLMEARPGLQPPYIAIHPAPARRRDGTPADRGSVLPRVMLRKITSGAGEVDAESARRLEGESLARWLKEEVFAHALIRRGAETALAEPRDVAILFRKLSDIHEYLEPFRRRGVRYVVEGERHFYAAKEIIDAINLLRAIDNPEDRLALVGVLRAPLGGVPDKVIYELHRRGLLDYRKAQALETHSLDYPVAELYGILARLHDETRVLPVGEALARVFAALPVRLLAAASFQGEQAVANLQKLKRQAEGLGSEGTSTLRETIRQLQRRVLDVREEGESVLAEESVDAVRIMSIHKAKGLEFPVVILAGCHAGIDARQGRDAEWLVDWSSGLTGCHVGSYWDLPGLYIAEKARLRTEEEHKRVLYVAMTRPREHLVISCAPTTRRAAGSFTAMLGQALGVDIDSLTESRLLGVGEAAIDIQVVSENLAAPGRPEGAPPTHTPRDWQTYVDLWSARGTAYEVAARSPTFLTPTYLKAREAELAEGAPPGMSRAGPSVDPLLVGDLAHRFLQEWDFAADPAGFRAPLGDFVARVLGAEPRRARNSLRKELEKIFAIFFGSEAYRELAGARILGREVPLLLPWDGNVMEGVIDLIYERAGLLWLADYKSDTLERADLGSRARLYHQQAAIYTRAVERSLGRSVAAFKFIFLRLGVMVEAPLPPAQGELFC
jgi:ATP-dependent helicase/nuclease subunit A